MCEVNVLFSATVHVHAGGANFAARAWPPVHVQMLSRVQAHLAITVTRKKMGGVVKHRGKEIEQGVGKDVYQSREHGHNRHQEEVIEMRKSRRGSIFSRI